jgi:2-polyprenyl-3-methyl-5-hydroxy-6-metoxy-1,4-benzoquinol methylase
MNWFTYILKAKTVHKQPQILAFCENKRVLDVGCIGQDLNPSSKEWLHNNIKSVAATLKGADINQPMIEKLNAENWDIVHPDRLETMHERFDVVVMGDVIEHVNDPGSFLTFYARFLENDGIIIVCTPNAFGIRYVLQVLFYGKPSTNPEHTLFLDPFVMLELVSRIDLKVVDFYWLHEYTKPHNWKQKFIRGLSSCFIFFRNYFRPNFMLVLQKNNAC